MSKVVVFLTNSSYFDRFILTCRQLINNGKYTGNICLIIGDDLTIEIVNQNEFIRNNKIIIVKFPNIRFPEETIKNLFKINTDGRNINKFFQWHKLHIFNTFFKKWNYVLFLDAGINIHSDIIPILECAKKDKLVAHSDAYPTYEWKLSCQFDKTKELYLSLVKEYDLNIDYFQTTILLFDTDIIEENTFKNLYDLVVKYPISRTNEQGIMNLYFNCKMKIYEQISIENEDYYFYAYIKAYNDKPYIMTKI